MLDIEVAGATVIEATGMAELIRSEMSLFAGFRNLFPNTGSSRIVMAMVSDQQAERLVRVIRRVCSTEDDLGKGIVFTVPVLHAYRLGNAPLPSDSVDPERITNASADEAALLAKATPANPMDALNAVVPAEVAAAVDESSKSVP
jgi:nitrogen regulatory protein PII